MVKIANSLLPRAKRKDNNPSAISPELLLQAHDEPAFKAREGKIQEIAKEIKRIRENVYNLGAPPVVEIGAGDNRGSFKEA